MRSLLFFDVARRGKYVYIFGKKRRKLHEQAVPRGKSGAKCIKNGAKCIDNFSGEGYNYYVSLYAHPRHAGGHMRVKFL